MQLAYSAFGVPTRMPHLFQCDLNPGKRAWEKGVAKAFETDPQSGSCIFKDIAHIGHTEAECAAHDKMCPVKSCDIFICCTSCKDISRISGGPGLVLLESESVGGSANTFKGFLSYIENHRPTLIFFENVDSIDDVEPGANASNYDIVVAEITARGYDIQRADVNSKLFGIPQHRFRMVLIAVLVVANPAISFADRSIDVCFQTMRDLMKVCQRAAPCATKLLLPDGDPAVEAELNRRLGAGEKAWAYNVAMARKCYNDVGLRWGQVKLPQSLAESPWISTLTAEQRDVVTYTMATTSKHVAFRDIGWSWTKVRCSTQDDGFNHITPTQLPKQLTMITVDGIAPRIQLGREAFLMHGFPVAMPCLQQLVDATPENVMTDLAGNMVSLPVILAMLMSAIAALSWRRESDAAAAPSLEPPSDALDAAFQLLSSLQPLPSDDPDATQKPRTKIRRMNARVLPFSSSADRPLDLN
jgi:site-specific DNA-cytosine methylase